jgi:hypothetical protein
MDTNYLNADIPVWGSRVVVWGEMGNMPVLIYHTKDIGYVVTDLSSLGQATINEIGRQSDVHGIWYFLPQSIAEVVSEEGETAIEVAKSVGKTGEAVLVDVAAAVGKAVGDLTGPLVDKLMIPLIIVGVIGMIYLIKKG